MDFNYLLGVDSLHFDEKYFSDYAFDLKIEKRVFVAAVPALKRKTFPSINLNFTSTSDIGRFGYGSFMNNKLIAKFRNFLIKGRNDIKIEIDWRLCQSLNTCPSIS